MRYVKKNKLTAFIVVIFVFLVFLGGYLYNIFFSSGRREAYGNRLDGIENVEITDKQYDELKKGLKENDSVVEVTTNLQVKTVNIIITVKDEVTKDNAKKIGNTVLEYFDDDQLAFFDIQVFVKKDNEELNDFPIIGYKQNGNKSFSWTKDRQVTKNEDK